MLERPAAGPEAAEVPKASAPADAPVAAPEKKPASKPLKKKDSDNKVGTGWRAGEEKGVLLVGRRDGTLRSWDLV